MADLSTDVKRAADRAVRIAADRGGARLDFSESSMPVVEEILAEASEHVAQLSDAQVDGLTQALGSYILEVARRTYGGTYFWHQDREPVLVVGDSESHVAIATWGKVRGRLKGDPADNIPFFYQGFSDRAKLPPQPGVRTLYV